MWAGLDVVEVPVRCTYSAELSRDSHFRPYADSFRQAAVHIRMVLLALLPWIGSSAAPTTRSHRGRIRHVLGWLNPLRCWRDLRDTECGSFEMSVAVGIGVWIGTLPFYGFHTLMALYVAWRLHLRPAAIVLGTQVSSPPWGVGLAIVSITVGHLMLFGTLANFEGFALSWSSISAMTGRIMLAWMLGGFIVGFVLGFGVWGVCQITLPFIRRRHAAVQPSTDDVLIQGDIR